MSEEIDHWWYHRNSQMLCEDRLTKGISKNISEVNIVLLAAKFLKPPISLAAA